LRENGFGVESAVKSVLENMWNVYLNESSLKKGWLCAEEDEAWADL
jgi:hypothetical protein